VEAWPTLARCDPSTPRWGEGWGWAGESSRAILKGEKLSLLLVIAVGSLKLLSLLTVIALAQLESLSLLSVIVLQ
jgi:hypothetical protein